MTRDAVLKVVEEILKDLADEGLLSLGKDDHLTGTSLEIRVYHLFQMMGFDVAYGRPKLEDLIVKPPAGATTTRPLVIEVKSEHKGGHCHSRSSQAVG